MNHKHNQHNDADIENHDHHSHVHPPHDHNDHGNQHSHHDSGHEHHSSSEHEGHHHHSHDHSEHGHHGHHHHGNFKEIFFKSLPLGLLILLMAPMMGIELPFQFTFPYSDLLVTGLATILLYYGGKPFYQGAIAEFKEKKPGMMALISLGVSVSYFYSVYAVVMRYISGQHVMDFFFEFASLILIMLLGHWIEMKAVGEAGDAQQSLAELIPKDAHVILDDNSVELRPVESLITGDIIRVQAGENIPADGIIQSGETRINEALITGESKPISKKPGDAIIGGTTNGSGTIYAEVTETGEKSFIHQVKTLIQQAQNQPSRAENLAHKVAGWLFYIALAAAIIALVVWFNYAGLQEAITFTVTTLVIACPHALGLAIPLVIARSTSLGAKRGLLVKDREALEKASDATVMLLDKTGTLTTGEFKVLEVQSLTENYNQEEIIALMAGIEAGSSHPIAQSITQYADNQNISAPQFDSIEIISGLGVEGIFSGTNYQLISEKAYGKSLNVSLPAGATVSILTADGEAIGVAALGDELKESSIQLIKALKKHNIQPIMATGDNELAAKTVAETLEIKYYSNQSPQNKYELIGQLQANGETVIMAGDGINDAPSLAAADVGIAIGAGTQVAIDSADVILTQSDPGDIRTFLELADKTNSKMKQNLVWGAGYNFIAIPIAAGILAPIGITLSPAVGAILMSLSTVIVAVNAVLLRLDS